MGVIGSASRLLKLANKMIDVILCWSLVVSWHWLCLINRLNSLAIRLQGPNEAVTQYNITTNIIHITLRIRMAHGLIKRVVALSRKALNLF